MTIDTLSRRGLFTAGAACAALFAASPGFAQASWPTRPIRFVVGFPAGGSADAVARILAGEMSRSLGQQVVVENKTGASGNIATQAVLAAPGDGHTIYLAQLNLASNPAIMSVGYDPQKDLAMVTQVVSLPVIALANGKSPLKTLGDVVKAGKEKKGELRFGGVLGTSSHLGPELLARDQGFTFKLVPYRGGALAVQALLSDEVDVVFDLMSGTLKSLLDAGTLTGLGVMQESAVEGLPKVVPAGGQGVTPAGFFRSWMGVCVRAGTSPEIVAKLHAAATAAVAKAEIRDKIRDIGGEVATSATPAEFQSFYGQELKRLGELIAAIGYKPQ